jgi:hypothetical protein
MCVLRDVYLAFFQASTQSVRDVYSLALAPRASVAFFQASTQSAVISVLNNYGFTKVT